jgi:hypothetical protein
LVLVGMVVAQIQKALTEVIPFLAASRQLAAAVEAHH